MNEESNIESLIGQPESEKLEYKAVLPPSRSLAQMMAGFANNRGGNIVLGVAEVSGQIEVTGLSSDFYITEVVQKAIALLSPQPSVSIEHLLKNQKRLFIIKIQKSSSDVLLEGKVYIRQGDKTVLKNPVVKQYKSKAKTNINSHSQKLNSYKVKSTGSKSRLVDHYQSILNILDDLETILFPNAFATSTSIPEGKILTRILFSSCADNFESYLSDLLYEIYLANPVTLKSDKQVSIKEVLNCTDMQEFIDYYARKKLSKLQRGSVKGFISENQQISDLNILDQSIQDDIERTLQIRHLYSHRNGIVDEKFLSFFPGLCNLNDEHCLSAEDLVNKMMALADTVNKLDLAAIQKFNLASVN